MIKPFTTFLTEAKNTHITHLEDDIFLSGYEGAVNSINFAKAVIKAFSSDVSRQVNMSVKWDGAPAVICGINPENGKFFVGTKSVFNKTPKINYTKADVRKNHSGGLVSKLEACLDYLPDLGIKGIVQGDLLFTSGDITDTTIDGKTYITFTPNTITYAIEKGTPLAKELSGASVGIVWHTTYNGKSMDSLSSSPGISPRSMSKMKTSNVWSDDARMKNMAGTVTFTKSETNTLNSLMTKAETDSSRLKGFLNFLQNNDTMRTYIETYINSMVRAGSTDLNMDSLLAFVEERENSAINKLKRETAIEARKEKLKEIINTFNSYSSALKATFSLHKALAEIKMILINKMNTVGSFSYFVKTDSGYRVTGQEGFVVADVLGKKTMKLVDRLEFSRINFTASKNWV